MPVSAEEKGREQRQGGGEKGGKKRKERWEKGEVKGYRIQNVYTNIYRSLRLFSRGINI